MPLNPYAKPWLSHANLVGLMVHRGLVVADAAAAERFFAHVNYYRISGYCLAFERPGQRHTFELGTTFEQIRSAYEFDFSLRDLVSEALEVIEIDLRTTVAHHFGQKYGAFGHTDPANFYRPLPSRGGRPQRRFDHAEWLTMLRGEVKRSKELFVEHFRRTYTEAANNDLPIWALAEVMSFGGVSKMIEGMVTADHRLVAGRYGLQPDILVSWTHHLNVARNVCAHHSRLWDRFWTVQPELPAGHAWRPPFLQDNRRLPVTLLILYRMLKGIPDVADWAAQWQARLRGKLADLPATPATPSLGFTADWLKNPVWA